MDFKFIDIHSHLNDKQFDVDRDGVISRMKEEGTLALVVGTDLIMSEKAIELATLHENLWATVGLHPTDNRSEKFDFEIYKKMAQNPRVVGIGECGLDYFYEKTAEGREAQKELFKQHLALSFSVGKPLMIHCRPSTGSMDAYLDLIAMLKDCGVDIVNPPGNIHFFSGNAEIARQFIALGFTLSFTGAITFTTDYDAVLRDIPLDHIFAETDCPYVAPVPHRGKRNEPAYVEFVIQKIAQVKGLSKEEVALTMIENARRVFVF
ncbi:MAG: TatD family hydrolase [Patescibacteria group bacterium]